MQAKIQSWFQHERLVVASFFFWYAGSPIRRSTRGLLLSLLHTLFKVEPGRVKGTVEKERWLHYWNMNSSPSSWSDDELWTVLGTFSSNVSILVPEFC